MSTSEPASRRALFTADSAVAELALELLETHIAQPADGLCAACANPSPCQTAVHARTVCESAGLATAADEEPDWGGQRSWREDDAYDPGGNPAETTLLGLRFDLG